MVVSIWSQQWKERKAILILFIISNLFNAGHFFLMNALTGAAMSFIGAARFGVSIFSIHKAWLVTFLVINTIATYMFFEGFILSGTSYFAATFIILSSFLKSDHWMRICIILGSFGWLVYGGLIGSIMAIVSGGFFFASSVVGWYRYSYLPNQVRIAKTQS